MGTKEVRDVEVFNPAVTYQNTFMVEPFLIASIPVRVGTFDVAEAYNKTKHLKAHSIFFRLTDAEWLTFKLNPRFGGNAWFVKDRIIAVGRWHEESTYQYSQRYKEPVRSLNEFTIGLAHEEAHHIHNLLNYTDRQDDCHYHFYGMRKKTDDSSFEINRWRRTPTPLEYFASFDWSRLPVLDVLPTVNSIALHHTAVSRFEATSQLNAVDRYHKESGYNKSSLGYYVGYNYFCDVDGTITQTREIGEETMAQLGHNCIGGSCAISICTAGDFNRELPADEQILFLRGLLTELRLIKYPNTPVVGHRDLQADRTCPGALLTQEYINVRLLGNVPPTPPDEEARKEALRKQLREAQITLIGLLRKYVKILTGRLNK